MRSCHVAALAILPLGLALLAFEPFSAADAHATAGVVGSATGMVAAAAPTGRAAEIARIRAHFDSVLAELPMRDISALTAAQRIRRSELLGRLRAYRDAGEFPRNYDFPGESVPYFVDRGTGVLCAVAHLVASTGRRDIVDRVAAMDNNVLVPELAGDTAFTHWLDHHGLTLAEAARIQVPYEMGDDPAPGLAEARPARTWTALALGGAAVSSILTASFNADGESRLGNVLGIVTGATAIGMGAASFADDGGARVGAASVLAGATSAWLSSRGIKRHRQAVAAKREADRATVAPLLPVDGKSGAGLSVTLKF